MLLFFSLSLSLSTSLCSEKSKSEVADFSLVFGRLITTLYLALKHHRMLPFCVYVCPSLRLSLLHSYP